jgi:Flp pilus assembly protein protease CpaA
MFIVVVALYVVAAGYTDLRMQRIPNYLTVPVAIAGLVCSLLRELALPGYPTTLPNCLLGFALGFAIFFIPFMFGGGGSGDLKLVAALGAWLGWLYLLFALVLSSMFALILAFVVWTSRFSASGGNAGKAKDPAKSGGNDRTAKPKPKARRRSAVPFAIPVALGTLCILGGMVLKNLYPETFQQRTRSDPTEQRR